MSGLIESAVADDLVDIGRAIQWVAEGLGGAGLSEDVRYALEVCLEEALANLILHGDAGGGAKDIAVGYSAGLDGVTVVVTDGCAPFDVTAVELQKAAPDRVGGRGVGLMRAFASELAYASAGGRNALTMRFRSDQGSSRPSASAAGSNS